MSKVVGQICISSNLCRARCVIPLSLILTPLMSVAAMTAAAVFTAGMTCAAVFMFVVCAFYCRVIVQFIIEQIIYCIIGLAGNAAIKLDACL